MPDYPAMIIEPPALLFGTPPALLISAVVRPIGHVPDGELIALVEPPWRLILEVLRADPSERFRMSPRQWEQMIAASYKAAGFDEVTLTPQSGDHGRDVVAIKRGIVSIRIIDQVKAYADGRVVPANDVRALLGVLSGEPNTSKGVVTTTARFAPRIAADPFIAPFLPYRLELVDGEALMKRLQRLPPK